VKRDAENDCSHVRTGGCRPGSANGGVRARRRGRLPRQLRRRLCGRGRRLPLRRASRHDAPSWLANTTSSGLQLGAHSPVHAGAPHSSRFSFRLPPMKKLRVVVRTVISHQICVERDGERTLYAVTDTVKKARTLVMKAKRELGIAKNGTSSGGLSQTDPEK